MLTALLFVGFNALAYLLALTRAPFWGVVGICKHIFQFAQNELLVKLFTRYQMELSKCFSPIRIFNLFIEINYQK